VPAATGDEVVDACIAAAEVSRGLASPYDRARTEMAIGRRYAASGDLVSARAHLFAASGLFTAAGASVWHAACEADLELLPAEAPVSVLTAPIAVPKPRVAAAVPDPVPGVHDHGDELAVACRRAWGDILTEREQDVALLVAQGNSNRAVAAQLYVSVRTVEVHLGRVFTKLGVPSRVALTVQAHRLARELQSLSA
jgi:DNA-binding CsgD family transcriptional regulator